MISKMLVHNHVMKLFLALIYPLIAGEDQSSLDARGAPETEDNLETREDNEAGEKESNLEAKGANEAFEDQSQ